MLSFIDSLSQFQLVYSVLIFLFLYIYNILLFVKKGWHLSACYRKYRIRESLLSDHEKRGLFYVKFRVRTRLEVREVQEKVMQHCATDEPE
jgi:hypothetical protein